ncbi:MAG: efflux RND transporter periplasmic adaptor subunit, partial [Pseudomonadota bacterium]|nr:efflux RND transporter periplasmic adaptor subunit [Pseudomonadota bacterium]
MNKLLKVTGGVMLIGTFATAGWMFAQQDADQEEHQLVKKADDAGKVYYTCAMHPQVHLDHPGNCPICGMALIEKSEAPQAMQVSSGGVVSINPRMAQNLGMRTAEVNTGSSVNVLEAVGSVQVNERSIVTIQSRTAGWIERLAVNAVGDVVSKGQTLATLYSPELYA